MGAREKQAWAMLVIAVGGLAVYLTLLVSARNGQQLIDVHYQPLMIGTILTAIVIGLITAVVFAVQAHRSGESDAADERDKAIDRFGTNVSQAFLVIGGLAALFMAMAEWDWFWIANTIYLGFTLSGVLEGVAKVSAYRRGLPW